MNSNKTALWLRIALFNLLLVALLGAIMRYKIAFSFPYLSQKHLQHAHSHFAFIGWVSHILIALMADALSRHLPGLNFRKYNRLILASLVCGYGMLFSFAAQGYGAVSITLSCISILISWAFAVVFLIDLRATASIPAAAPVRRWFSAALLFNVLSAAGTFALGYMMATRNFDSELHLASLYYYLHFQYNGFFMFACFGLWFSRMPGLMPSYTQDKTVFWLFFLACIPAYLLSVVWMKMPMWLFAIMVLAALLQVIAWARFLLRTWKATQTMRHASRLALHLLLIVALATTAKFLLQLGSTIPALSKLAFGFRPVVIAYLHLILLAIISVFIVSYLYLFNFMRRSTVTKTGLVLFVIGVYFNEIVLGVQGIASFSYTMVPYANEMLFAIAALILVSILVLLVSQRKTLKTAE